MLIDIIIFIIYFFLLLGIGVYFHRKNKSSEDYYVGGRTMNSTHIGLSVVATDVGGGFSIGLGGLGFAMGISGSWMLFTGLIGAWLSAVLLIPAIYSYASKNKLQTFPQLLKRNYTKKVVITAATISTIGYVGFTGSQLLAGAKLAHATITDLSLQNALLIMGAIAVAYTVMGGLKAVIYTDTFQWIILMSGLIFVGIPAGYMYVGGWEAIKANLAPEFLSLTNVTAVQIINWFITIIPIWFIGMTLYQRIFSCRDEKTARRAWYVAGLFEYPVMAFMGTILGMLAKVAFIDGTLHGVGDINDFDPEMGLPLFLRNILPIGLKGLVLSAYFSAIMSTADSTLMAASGHLVTDIFGMKNPKVKVSQIVTFVIGAMAITLAMFMQNVLEFMLYSYAFMVSGLFIPVLAMIFLKRHSSNGAMAAMIGGGTTTLTLSILKVPLPFGLDPVIFGVTVSALFYALFYTASKQKFAEKNE